MRTMCFLNKQTNISHQLAHKFQAQRANVSVQERTMFSYDLSQRAADNILPQRANVLPQCLYMTIMNTSFSLRSSNSLIAFRCSALIQFNSTSNILISSKPDNDTLNLLLFCMVLQSPPTWRNSRLLEAASDQITPMIVAGSHFRKERACSQATPIWLPLAQLQMLDRQSYFFQIGAWVYTLNGILLTCGYILVIVIINHFTSLWNTVGQNWRFRLTQQCDNIIDKKVF